ncbi:Ankyrin repeat domain-containing protein [Plasmodiophora brassicae]|uniref:Uncharacterized protein n=1 Tax=Plasmodiophora brassicae TaxID=37360 RepID=A0A0G4IVZ0_PLABS|nr:hypothetical protein PBRA_007241 [Plasmodiophora brassicae]
MTADDAPALSTSGNPDDDNTVLAEVRREFPGDVIPDWGAHVIASVGDVVPAATWIDQLRQHDASWASIPAVETALRLAALSHWMSQEEFVAKVMDPDADPDIPQQNLGRFICVEVLKALRKDGQTLDRRAAIRVTRNLVAQLASPSFQRVAADYTWDRVVFDTIPFMVDFAQRIVADDNEGTFATALPDLTPHKSVVGSAAVQSFAINGMESAHMYAWHLYMELQGTERLVVAREAASDLVLRNSFPLHACCQVSGPSAADIAAVLVLEHRQSGPPAKRVDQRGNTAAHYAAERVDGDHGRLVRVLFSAGVDFDVRNASGFTPVAVACRAGADLQTVLELVRHSSAPHAGDDRGVTPMHFAVRAGRPDLVQLLDDEGGDVAVPDHDGFTPVHTAAACGSASMLELLASKGASLDVVCREGNTPLAIAARRKNVEAANFLFQTRNFLAARFPAAKGVSNDDGDPPIYAMLRTQLPHLSWMTSVSMTGLGIDRAVPEVAYLREARAVDVRHNNIRTYWWVPWWWLSSVPRHIAFWLSFAFVFVWTTFAMLGLTFSTEIWWYMFDITGTGLEIGLADISAALFSAIIMAHIAFALWHGFAKLYERIEARFAKQSARYPPFHLRQNAFVLVGLAFELVELTAVALSVEHRSTPEVVLRGFLLDFGKDAWRTVTLCCVIAVCLLRLWVEARSFLPSLWAADQILSLVLTATFLPICRVLLSTFSCPAKSQHSPVYPPRCYMSPPDIVLFIAALGSLIVHVPLVMLSEPVLQARDGCRQIRMDPAALVGTRTLFFVLALLDVVTNQAGAIDFHLQCVCALLVLMAIAGLFVIGKPVLDQVVLQIRLSVFWAAAASSIVLVASSLSSSAPPSWSEAFVPWAVVFAICAMAVSFTRWRIQTRAAADRQTARRSSVMSEAKRRLRLHPRFPEIAAEIDAGTHFTSLDKKFALNAWLRSESSSTGEPAVTVAALLRPPEQLIVTVNP